MSVVRPDEGVTDHVRAEPSGSSRTSSRAPTSRLDRRAVASLEPTSTRTGELVRWLGQVVAWTVLLALGAVLTLSVIAPTVTGGQAYTVLSGSMEPRYPIGSLVVTRPVDAATIQVGDVITYQLRSGEPTVVTHRVVGTRMIGDERGFVTQGDANAVPDQAAVRPVQVRGVVWYAVPGLGYVNHALGGPVRAVLLPLAVVGLLGYAAAMFLLEGRDRRRIRREAVR